MMNAVMETKRQIGILVIAFGLSVLCACADPITNKDNGKRYEFPEDTEFTVQLAGNPTTGYSWSVAACDSEVVAVSGEPVFKADNQMVGAGGIFEFTFRTVGAGETDIVFHYERPWEKESPSAKTFKITVISGTMGVIEAR